MMSRFMACRTHAIPATLMRRCLRGGRVLHADARRCASGRYRHFRDLYLSRRRSRPAPDRESARRKARSRFYTSMATTESRPARAGIREEIRRQGPALAGAERECAAARAHRSARRSPQHGRGRDQCARSRGARARAGGCAIRQPVPRRPAGLGDSAPPALVQRPGQSLGDRLQHRQGQARGTARDAEASPIRNGKAGSRIEATDNDWMYGVISFMGEARGREFFRKLAALKPEMRKGHVLVAQLVAAGEVSVCLTIYSGNADSIKAKGGPIDWVAVEPLVGRPQAIGAREERAASTRGAAVCRFRACRRKARSCSTTWAACRRAGRRRRCSISINTSMIDPIKWIDEAPKWEKVWNELFLKWEHRIVARGEHHDALQRVPERQSALGRPPIETGAPIARP